MWKSLAWTGGAALLVWAILHRDDENALGDLWYFTWGRCAANVQGRIDETPSFWDRDAHVKKCGGKYFAARCLIEHLVDGSRRTDAFDVGACGKPTVTTIH